MNFKKTKNEFGWIYYTYKFQNIIAQIHRDYNSSGWDCLLEIDEQVFKGIFKTKKECEKRIDKILAGEFPFDVFRNIWFDGIKLTYGK